MGGLVRRFASFLRSMVIGQAVGVSRVAIFEAVNDERELAGGFLPCCFCFTSQKEG